jgi:predicted porin
VQAYVRSTPRRLAALAQCIALSTLAGTARAQDRVDVLLERIDKQDREIQELRQEVNELRGKPVVTQPPPPTSDAPQQYRREEGDDPLADYGNPGIRLEISGQINQAINFAGDGHDTKAYFVDNDTSNTRLRFAGVARFKEGLEIGPLLEVAFSPNPSSDVSQDREIAGDFFQVRRAELYALDERFGRVTLGRGSSAADNTAEYDLSLVSGPIMYSGISDIVGGLQFTHDGKLTGTHVNQAFFNFDGNRQNRVGYDSPMLGPVQLSLSYGADQQKSAALTFGGDYGRWSAFEVGPFTMLGAVSIADPNQHGVNFRTAGSWSVLHDATGLNLTFSGGADDTSSGGTPYNLYGKLGWNTKLTKLGPTGFGVDYTWTENVSGSGDKGQGVGIAAVQVLQRYGIELYTQFRWYSVDRADRPRFDDIFVGTMGTRVRF